MQEYNTTMTDIGQPKNIVYKHTVYTKDDTFQNTLKLTFHRSYKRSGNKVTFTFGYSQELLLDSALSKGYISSYKIREVKS